MPTRTEHDHLGTKQVPSDAYYGVQTQRAIENFKISGLRAHKEFIIVSALIKKAAAEANMSTKSLNSKIGRAISTAASEIMQGKLHDQFILDVFQAGAGTSHNMNVNEVIANRALELLGKKKGRYELVHPNDHVNMSQSTNDFYPTVMRLAALQMIRSELLPNLHALEKSLAKKGVEFSRIKKSGRTHLQDAVPITLGSEFKSYALAMKKARIRIQEASKSLEELGIGGTAVGSGLNTHPQYRAKVVQNIKTYSKLAVRSAADLYETTNSAAPFVEVSGALKELAVELIRIANDIRLLGSGPTTGFGELKIPAVQPGSSIMPGKVNPVIAECVNMIGFQVIGNDTAVTFAAQAGQLELNVMKPVINYNLLQSIEILANGASMFDQRLIRGLKADKERCAAYLEGSVGLATILNPYIGYEASGKIAKEAIRTGKSIRTLVLEQGLMTEKEFNRALNKNV